MRAEFPRSGIASAFLWSTPSRLNGARLGVRKFLLAVSAASACVAAHASEPRILVANRISIPEGGEAALAIKVESKDKLPEGSYLLLVSPTIPFSLSAGSKKQLNNWWLKFSDLQELKIGAPVGTSGKGKLHLFLYSPRADVLAQAAQELVVEPPASSAVSQPPLEARQAEAAKPPAKELIRAAPTLPGASVVAAAGQTEAARQTPPENPALAIEVPPPGGGRGNIVAAQVTNTASSPIPAGEAKAAVQPLEIKPAGPPKTAPLPPPAEPASAKAAPEGARAVPVAPAAAARIPEPNPPAGASREAKTKWPRFIEQGERQFALGNVVVARQYFLLAADTGSATGALRLAETYDADKLERFLAFGLKADLVEAKRWYEVAARLGAPQASERLKHLVQK